MASNAEVIKEFLVSLGYEVDQESSKKFSTHVGGATTQVMNLGKAAIATATAIELMVKRVADRMNDLFYLSQRTNATVQSLDALGASARVAGIGVEEMQNLVGGLAAQLRENPGKETFLNSIGVQTRNLKHELLGADDIMHNFVDKMRKMGPPGSSGFVLANLYANFIGMSSDQLLLLEKFQPAMDAAAASFIKMQQAAGITAHDLNDDTGAFHQFSMEMLDLERHFTVLGEKIALDFLPWTTPLIGWTEEAIDEFLKLDKATDGWAGALLSLSGGEMVLARIFALISRIGGGAGAMSAALGEAGAVGLSAFAWVPQTIALLSAFVNFKANQQLDSDSGGRMPGQVMGEPVYRDPSDNPLVRWGEGIGSWLHGGGGIEVPSAGSASGGGNRIMDYFMKQGWSRSQAAGIAASLQRESNFDPNAINGASFGAAQWLPNRQADFARWAGHDIHQSSIDEQLAFIQYELTRGKEQKAGGMLRSSNTPTEASNAFTAGYERPKDLFGEMAARSNLAEQWAKNSMTMSQSTTINVTGSTNPDATAAAIAGHQSRVNGDFLRNAASSLF